MLTAKHTKYAKSRNRGQAVSCSRPHRFRVVRVVRGSCTGTGNGNVTYLVNSSQTLAASYRYDAFGNLLSSSGDLAAANKYRFSSKEWVDIDPWTQSIPGIYYYGYRFYVPSLQRWLNRDPLEFVELLAAPNLYGYVNNDSVNDTDVDGRLGFNPRKHKKPKQDCEANYRICTAAGIIVCGCASRAGISVATGCAFLWYLACEFDLAQCKKWNKRHYGSE